jgi:nucleotide-binding universal stress UspA family protein
MNETTAFLHGTVTVGIDGSAGAERALHWAAREAELRRSRLRIVHAVRRLTPNEIAWLSSAGVAIEQVRADAHVDAEHLVKDAAESVRVAHPGLRVDTAVVVDDERSVLLAEGQWADLVVVGSRGRGPIRSLLLGSVGVTLVRHSTAPVAVVRTTDETARGGVLVGTNGTASSLPALRTAFREADLRGVPLTVMHCLWDAEVGTTRWVDLSAGNPLHEDRRTAVERLLVGLRAEHPDVEVSIRITRGAPDRCLVDLSGSTDLVVVGRHGATPLDVVGLGTVSTPVVEHADTVVLVVPGDEAEER